MVPMAEFLKVAEEKELCKVLDSFFTTYDVDDLSFHTQVQFGDKLIPLGKIIRSVFYASEMSLEQRERLVNILARYGATPEKLMENSQRVVESGAKIPDLVVGTTIKRAAKMKREREAQNGNVPTSKKAQTDLLPSKVIEAEKSYVDWAAKVGPHGILDALKKIRHLQSQGIEVPDVVSVGTTQLPSAKLVSVLRTLHGAGRLDERLDPIAEIKDKISRKRGVRTSESMTIERAHSRARR